MMFMQMLAAVTAVTGVHDSYPALSPDGATLVFSSNRSGRQALWLAAPDGSNPRILFDEPRSGTEPGTAQWSPNGKTILFGMRPAGSTDEDESEIYLIGADGRGLKRLTSVPGDDSHPHWSNDGKQIFFNSARATPDLSADWSKQWIDIYSMTADGGDVRKLTDCRSVCTYPVPSPDGRMIAYRYVIATPGLTWELDPGARNSEVFVSGVDGANPVNVSNSGAYDGWPMWSPDSRWVAFASNRDHVPSVGQIYRVRPDGTALERLTNGPLSHVQPSFSRDGKALYVYRLTEAGGGEIGGIAKIDLESGH
jgi:TolB protein